MRAARAARLLFLLPPIKFLICGVVVAVDASLILELRVFTFPTALGRTVNCSRLTKHRSDDNYHLTVLIPILLCFLGEDGILHTGSAI